MWLCTWLEYLDYFTMFNRLMFGSVADLAFTFIGIISIQLTLISIHIIWLLVVVIRLDWVDPDLLEDVTFTMDLGRVVLVFTYIGYINIFIHISDLVDPDWLVDFHLLEDIIFTMDLQKVSLVFTFIMLTIIWVLVVVICLHWVDFNLTYSRLGLTCSQPYYMF